MKPSTNASLFRRFRKSWLSYNNTGKQFDRMTPKVLQRSNTTLMPIDNDSENITVIKVA